MLPYVFGNGVELGIVDFPAHVVDCGINDHPSDPADQQHFDFLLIPDLKTVEIPEHLQESVVGHLRCLLIRIYVPKGNFDT